MNVELNNIIIETVSDSMNTMYYLARIDDIDYGNILLHKTTIINYYFYYYSFYIYSPYYGNVILKDITLYNIDGFI